MVNASPALKHTRLRDDAQLYVERLLCGFEPCDLTAATGTDCGSSLARREGRGWAHPEPHSGLAEDAITGLRQALAGQFVSDEELDQALGVASAP